MRRRLGRPPLVVRVRHRASRPAGPSSPTRRRRRSSGPASPRSTGRSAGSGRSGSSPDRRRRGSAGAHRGGDRRRRGRRLPDPRPRRHRGRPAALRAARASRSRPGSRSSRRPGPAPTERRRGRGATDPRVRPFGPTTSRRWPRSTPAATGEDRRHLLRRLRDARTTARVLEPATTGSAGSWSARHGAAAPRSPRTRTMRSPCSTHAGAGRGPDRHVRAGILAGTRRARPPRRRPAGPRPGGRRGSSGASRSPGSPRRSGASSTTPSAEAWRGRTGLLAMTTARLDGVMVGARRRRHRHHAPRDLDAARHDARLPPVRHRRRPRRRRPSAGAAACRTATRRAPTPSCRSARSAT